MGVVAIFLLTHNGLLPRRHAGIEVVGSIFFDANEVVLVAIGDGLSSRKTRIVLWVSAIDGAIFAEFEARERESGVADSLLGLIQRNQLRL